MKYHVSAPMGIFQLQLIYCFTFIFHRRHIQHLYGPGDRNFNSHKTYENVVLTTKGLQERNTQMLDGMTVENKGKTIN